MASTAGIASLLDTHKEEVARLLAVTAPERSIARGAELLAAKQMNISDAPMTIYDELFVLRFLLSHPTNPLPSLRSSLQFRAAHAPGLLLRRLSKAPPHHDLIQPFCIQENHGHAKDGSPLFIVRSGLTNLSPLMDHSSPEMVGEWMLYLREADFHDCDSKSREKGRITKMLSVIDFNHSSLSNSLNREFFKALGMSSKWSEGYCGWRDEDYLRSRLF